MPTKVNSDIRSRGAIESTSMPSEETMPKPLLYLVFQQKHERAQRRLRGVPSEFPYSCILDEPGNSKRSRKSALVDFFDSFESRGGTQP